MTDPILDQARPSVPALPVFRNIHSDGTIVTSTPAYPNDKWDGGTRYYFCSIKNASMHRPDGKKLAFVNGVCATDFLYDIKYFEDEIAGANPHIREATKDEIYAYRYAMDPRGTLAGEIKHKVESEVRDQLTSELMASMRERLANGEKIEDILGAVAEVEDPNQGKLPIVEPKVAGDAAKLAGSETPSERAARLKASLMPKVDVGSGTFQPFKPVSTADVASAAVQSGK